jgi:hypothetical protein
MIYEAINDFQIDLFEGPKRLGNLSFPIDFNESLPLSRSGFRRRKYLEVNWIIPRHSVVQLSEHFTQDWSFRFAEETVPKPAMILQMVPGVVAARLFALPGHKHGQSRPGRGDGTPV